MDIKLKQLEIQNFKGIKDLTVDFADLTEIRGQNALGKTTIMDAFIWLLFDRDSQGSSTFSIRPKDESGADVDFVEIEVTATLGLPDGELTLTKTQKQKWVKKRGQETQTFEGNVNEFQINGFPAKKAEYETRIRSIIDENLFRLLTNPRMFAAMKWQDQRRILLEFVSEITDRDVLDTDPKYKPIAYDVLEAGADKVREKVLNVLKNLKKDQAEYPVRIDEALKSIPEGLDEEIALKEKKRAEEAIKAVQAERDNLQNALKSVSDIQAEILQTKLDMGNVERAVADANTANARVRSDAIHAADTELFRLEAKRDRLADNIRSLTAKVADKEKEIADLVDRYKSVRRRTMPKGDTVCPTCGREYPADQIESIETAFNERKTRDLDSITKRGKELRASVDNDKEQMSLTNKEINALTEEISTLAEKTSQMKTEAATAETINFRLDPKYIELEEHMAELQGKLSSLDSGDTQKQVLREREEEARKVLEHANADLAAVDASKHIKERVSELKAEQIECAQKIADQERIAFLLEEFTKTKMDMLSDKINSKFDHVRFRLFDQQINGGLRETCVMQIASNGAYVDYKDANNAAQIVGGLDVIKALSGLYEVTAPIFIDNSEAVNDFNLPRMEAQVILLRVTEDKALKVTNKERK